jgi:hypothetical protein
VALAPHGDAVDGTSGQPVALSPTSFLVAAEGADGVAGTADDETLLVRGLGGSPSLHALATGGGATDAARIERLSSSRAVMVSSGVDTAFGTADDALLVLDRLGSGNAVVPVVIGGLGDNQQFTPERLTSNRVVLPSFGTDLAADTADDEVVVVTISPAPAQVQRLAAPYQRAGGRTRMAALSPEAFLIASDGPDRKSSGADDLVYSFRLVDGGWVRTDLAAPGLNRRSAGRCVRLSARYGMSVSAGPDYTDSTADDQLLLLDSVGGSVTPITIPFLRNGSGAQATGLRPDLAVVGTRGADGLDGTADDAVAILSGLGSANAVASVVVGPCGDNNECRPVRLADDAFAMVTFGADSAVGTADDSITVVTGIGGSPLVQSVVIGAVANGTTSTVVPLSGRALLLSGGGQDQTVGTSDDAIVVLSGIRGPLAVHSVPLGGALDAPDAFRFVPVVLGGNRAVVLTSGADDSLGTGDDDAVRVIDGLELGRSLRIRRLQARFSRGQGAKRPSRVGVEGALVLEEPRALLEEDLTVSVGNAAQTIPAGSLVPDAEGRVLLYRDPLGEQGVVRSLRIDTLRGTMRLDLRGADDEVESTEPDYVPVGLDVGGVLVPESLVARAGRNGFSYRRPRGGD